MKNFIYVIIILAFSCQESNYEEVEKDNEMNQNQRISFDSFDEMYKTIYELDKKSLLDQEEWSNSKLCSSYYNSNTLDSTLMYKPNSFKSILNSDLEFRVNDSIMWYNDNNIYFLSDNKDITKRELEKVKSSKNLPIVLQPYNLISLNQQPNTRVVRDLENKGSC